MLYSAQFCANCSPRLVKTTGRLLVLLQFLNCLPVFFFIFVGSFKELTVSAPIYGPTSLDRPIEKLGLLLPCHTEITLQETIEIRNEGIHLFTAEFFGQRLVIDITSILFVTRIYDAAKVESALSWLGTSKVTPGQLWPTADCSTKWTLDRRSDGHPRRPGVRGRQSACRRQGESAGSAGLGGLGRRQSAS